MSLGTLVLGVAVVALILTLAIGFAGNKLKSWVVSYLQNFTGVLFIISGFVKAVDPLGTAYKMEQYFAEFEATFEETALSFMGPLFPQLAEYAIAFSVGMIVFEILLGVMLIVGAFRTITSWAFFLLVAFFTFLTGFTYLTGYVPEGVNFFQFSKWGSYVETNMKVTDCGCFGDFIKLKPFTSFMKDVFLLVPALIFLFSSNRMHQILTPGLRYGLIGITLGGTFLYCVSNYSWDLPQVDFRPFKVGTHLAEEKARQDEAINNIRVIAYKVKDKNSGKVIEIPYKQYLKEYKNYPDSLYEKSQIKSEPAVKINKISEFDVSSVEGYSVTDEILNQEGYSFMVVGYKLKGKTYSKEVISRDTVYTQDTVRTGDSVVINRSIAGVNEKKIIKEQYDWNDEYIAKWREKLNPVMDKAMEAGATVYGITGPSTEAQINDFRHASQSAYPIYTADDILLKTIIRSNPGIVLLKDGQIIEKWHIKKFPEDFEAIQSTYMD